MRLDTGNRAFLLLVGLAAVVAGWIGLVACCVIGIVAYEIGDHGLWATAGSGALRPALVLIAVLLLGSALGLRSVIGQSLRTWRLTRWVRAHRAAPPPQLQVAAARAGLSGQLEMVETPEQTAFTSGFVAPRVVVSHGMLDTVSSDELAAVLLHERHHVRNRDPLKVFVARAVPPAFFYLPALRGLRDRYVIGRELAADRRAVNDCGREPLAAAIYKLVRGPDRIAGGAAAAIGGDEALEARVLQLETGVEPEIVGVSPTALLASMAGGAVVVWSVLVSLLAFGGPGGLMARLCGGA